MAKIPLGRGAFKRTSAADPEIRLVNRFFEKNPTNTVDQVALVGRFGTTGVDTFTGGINRGNYSKKGIFDTDLFVVAGANLWRKAMDGTKTQITGTIYGDGHPYVAWAKGAGYERLFISDGLLLQYYDGGSVATGIITLTPASPPDIGSQVINIGTAYYSWHATDVDNNAPTGTSTHPWLAKKGVNDAASLANMANLIKYAGVPGVDFSSDLPGPSLEYTADSDATHLNITSLSSFADANSIATTVLSGSHLAWGSATLTGAGTHALVQVETPDGAAPKALAALSEHILVSIGGTRRFYWILPGEVIIDPLDFAEKESQPDPIVDLVTLGDQTLITGAGSSEWWYATGDSDAPFAPIKGNAFSRGTLDGTAVAVGDNALILVGDDNVVYEVSGAGVKPISDYDMSERIRRQVRREAGLP